MNVSSKVHFFSAIPPIEHKDLTRDLILDKRPLIDFEEPKTSARKNLMSQEQLIKQLLAIQKMK